MAQQNKSYGVITALGIFKEQIYPFYLSLKFGSYLICIPKGILLSVNFWGCEL